MTEFKISGTKAGDTFEVAISGSVDEDSNMNGAPLQGENKIVLDLEGVTAINSCGIREWIKWIRTASEGAQIVYKNCPKVIVDQINMVAGFLPEGGKVESFYVPYYSEESGTEKMVLFKEGKEFQQGEVNPPESIKDEKTGEEMEIDVIEAKYFKFINK